MVQIETAEAPPVDVWSGLATIDAARAAEPLPIDPYAVRPSIIRDTNRCVLLLSVVCLSIISGANRSVLLRLPITRGTKRGTKRDQKPL